LVLILRKHGIFSSNEITAIFSLICVSEPVLCRSFRTDDANYGKCPSKKETYYGFKELIYIVMKDTKKPISKQMTEFDKTKMMSDFSKGLTLWGSNKDVEKIIKKN